MLQTPLHEGAYVAIQRIGGRFCNRGFGDIGLGEQEAREILGRTRNDDKRQTVKNTKSWSMAQENLIVQIIAKHKWLKSN